MKKQLLTITMFTLIGLTNLVNAQTLVWAKAMGGTDYDAGNSMVLDASGNIFTTGFFTGTVDFDPGAGIFSLTSAGDNDIFISKLDSAGNFIWAKAMGGTAIDHGYSIALDGLGNVYSIGEFQATADFDPGVGIFNLTSLSGYDIYISKLDAAGNFVWAKQFGSANIDGGRDIAVDASGNVYTTGYFRWTVDFDPGTGTFNLTSSGGDNGFISKLDAAGNFAWAIQIGGMGPWIAGDFGYGIATDGTGNVYTTGTFTDSVDFNPGTDVFKLDAIGGSDVFISKIDPAGNFVWAKQMGGSNINAGNSITVDATGNVYTTGFFWGTGDFDPGSGTFNLIAYGDKDIFVSKLDAGGNFVWAKAMGGGGTAVDIGNSIAVDASGNVYTTGFYTGTADFDPGDGTYNLFTGWGSSIFFSKLDASGNFVWATRIGGVSGLDGGNSIALDAYGSVYTTGAFGGVTDFDPGDGTFNLTAAGASDIFINKMGQTGVGLSENEWSNTINLFPNPTTGKFTIDIKNIDGQAANEIEIYNAFGEKVYTASNIKQQNEIDLSDLSKGVYFIKMYNGIKIYNQKIVVQ
ncbi:MAG: T9SS type A sorting domain-containing protein [Bacteroidales bacterium]|nr:T9SS type A sorting domain-containing protein [Bacteroidales bacterium]